MKKIILLISLCFVAKIHGQIIAVDLNYKLNNAPYILKGEVLNENFEEDKMKTTIFSFYTIKTLTVYKGEEISNTIKVKIPGGELGNKKLIVCPNSTFNIGDTGIYFLNKIEEDLYEPAFLGQSEYIMEKDVYKSLDIQNKKPLSEVKIIIDNQKNSISKNTLASITSISPTTLNAGIGEVVTITGSGFGATGPPSGQKVWVVSSLNPNNYVSQSGIYNYVSWSDTEIKYKVSSDAATGKIRVGFASTYAESTQILQINYNVRDEANANSTAIFPVKLPAISNGGISFKLNTNFTNLDAINSTKIAMDSWSCATDIKLGIDQTATTTNLNSTSDNQSVLFFASLGTTVLGLTYSTISGCSLTGRFYVSDIDLGINSSQPFNYTMNPTPNNQFDYYNVVLHELGHVGNQKHVNDVTDIMHPSVGMGVLNRNLSTNNINGGIWIQNDSQTGAIVCARPNMTSGVCLNLSSVTNEIKNNNTYIYPNPNKGKFTINSNNELVNQVQIYSLDGKLIFTQYINEINPKITIPQISKGIYLINILFENGNINKGKIIIE